MKKTWMVRHPRREKVTPGSRNSWSKALKEKPLNKLKKNSTKPKKQALALRAGGISSTTASVSDIFNSRKRRSSFLMPYLSSVSNSSGEMASKTSSILS